ncbi:glycosyltransferase [Nitrospira sp. M1]
MPHKKHVVTMRDTRDHVDWKMEYALPSIGKLQVLSNYLYEDNPLVRKAVQKAHGVYCAAHLLIPKVQEKYKLLEAPSVLPTPVVIPKAVCKAETPTVCYMGRWDRRKRPELFLQLAESFPAVQFIAVGSSRDREWDAHLRSTFAHVRNLDMPGFVDQFDSERHSRILEESWILVNTATREGLPNSFLEAAAHGCAILSAVNPDGFSSDFGYHVTDNRFDVGLTYLLENNRWEERGTLGRQYVQENFEVNHAISLHIQLYDDLINDCVSVE